MSITNIMKMEGLCRDIVAEHTIRSTVQHGHPAQYITDT